jgi:hypothetical protein
MSPAHVCVDGVEAIQARSPRMGTPPRLLAISLLFVTGVGCDSTAPSSARDAAIVRRDAPTTDVGLVDAYSPLLDALCFQSEPDPDRAVTCSLCEPRCFRTRDQPRESGPAAGGLEYDETLGGLRLPREADGTFVSAGRHQRVHDTTVTCDPLLDTAHWTFLDYQIDVPAGASADFELRAASSLAGIAGATPVVIPAVSGVGHVDLDASGFPVIGLYLSVTVALHASPDGTESPVLHHYDLEYTCASAF